MMDQNRLRRLGVVLFILTLAMLVIHMESLIRFNRQEFRLHGNEVSRGIQMDIDARADSTSSWLKRSFLMDDGKTVDLIGQTIDGTLVNQSADAIQDWELRINILGDCYINQAWNGEVEIHQFTGTDREVVQRLNLQNYQLEDVQFEYRYDGDLLIPLQQGDYVIYYPSARFSEMPINGGDDVKIGVIFYYLNDLNLSDYDVQIHFHRYFTQGVTFYVFVGLAALWLLAMTLSGAGTLAYRRAMKEMELRKSGIFCMSDIYDLIYIIHLPTGEMTPVSVNDKMEKERPKNKTAKELLTDMVKRDAEDKYRDLMLTFVDTDTLAERLSVRDSIATEFKSAQYGWCSLRFYAMDRVEGKPIENVVFTVQDINEEKQEQEAIIQRIEEAKSVNEAKALFMDNIADDLQKPLEHMMALNDRILRESGDDAVKGYARGARCAADRLLMLTNGIADGFGMESGEIRPAEAYSLRALLTDSLRAMLPLAEHHGLTMALDVAEGLPDGLEGQPRIMREILVVLMSGLLHRAQGGSMQLAVYGKALEGKIHLLVSVRVLSEACPASDGPDAPGETTGLTGLSEEVVSKLLKGVGSTLKTVRAPAGRMEQYFEIEQRVLDAAPVGKLTVEDIGA